MARKTKVKKSKARKVKTRAARGGAPVEPTYLPEGSYGLGLHDVVRALKVIDKHGHMSKFVRAAKAQQARAEFDAKTVNFVKDFMVKHKMHTDPIGKQIVNPRQAGAGAAAAAAAEAPACVGPPFNCKFGS